MRRVGDQEILLRLAARGVTQPANLPPWFAPEQVAPDRVRSRLGQRAGHLVPSPQQGGGRVCRAPAFSYAGWWFRFTQARLRAILASMRTIVSRLCRFAGPLCLAAVSASCHPTRRPPTQQGVVMQPVIATAPHGTCRRRRRFPRRAPGRAFPPAARRHRKNVVSVSLDNEVPAEPGLP